MCPIKWSTKRQCVHSVFNAVNVALTGALTLGTVVNGLLQLSFSCCLCNTAFSFSPFSRFHQSEFDSDMKTLQYRIDYHNSLNLILFFSLNIQSIIPTGQR